jgi:hypothetical protein
VTSSVYPQATGTSALKFDGSANSYLTLPSSGLSNFTTGLSMGLWVYPTSNAAWQRFFDIGNGPGNNNIILCRNSGSNDLAFYSFNGGAATTVVASNVIELNKWQYFAVSMEANGTTTLYKNGVAVATGTSYVPTNVTRTNAYVGKSNWGDALYSGQMSDLSIWNRPLAQTEVSSAASTLFTGNETGLIGYWPMKELSGTTVKDVSPAQRNGTSQSGVTSAVASAGRLTVPGIQVCGLMVPRATPRCRPPDLLISAMALARVCGSIRRRPPIGNVFSISAPGPTTIISAFVEARVMNCGFTHTTVPQVLHWWLQMPLN